MHYLPSKYDTRKSPVVEFLKKYEPDDREKARAFREDLMAAVNHHLPNGQQLVEHPDSMYLEI